MNTIKYFKTLAASALLAFASAGCTDYLDVVPPETADLPDAMKDKQDAIDFLYSCYSICSYNNGFASVGAHESSTDEFAHPVLWGRLSQVTAWNQLSSSTVPNNALWNLPWSECYSAIGVCHFFEKTLAENNPKGCTTADITRWMAEIKFLKAYYHFRVLESYGPCPIIDHYYGSDTQKEDIPGRSHFDYCVDRIVQWLDEAAAVLPATVENSELGRATSTIALALKGRVLLYAASPLWNGSFPWDNFRNVNYETPGYGLELVSHQYSREKWVRARQACQEALDYALTQGNRAFYTEAQAEIQRQNDEVPLPNIPGTDEEFRRHVMHIRYANTAVETEGNREVVWGVISNPDMYPFWFGDHCPHNVLSLSDGGRAGGITALSPLLYTVEHFYTRNGILPKDDPEVPNSRWFESAGLTDHERIITLCDKREPRFYACISFDGDEYTQLICDGHPLIVDNLNSMAQGYNPDLYNQDNSTTGFYCKKWCEPSFKISINGSWNGRRSPARLIRLSELYLNLAECEAELGNTDAALKAVNAVRTHNHIPELTTENLGSMSLIDWIRNERFVELWGESHRYYDARRWMIAPEVFRSGAREGLNALAKKDPTFEEFNQRTKVDQPFAWDTRMYLLPINVSEVYNNPQLIQAPNY